MARQRGQVKGWDVRDYKLWSALQDMPHYGTLPRDDRLVSLKDVRRTIETLAEKRWNDARFPVQQEAQRG